MFTPYPDMPVAVTFARSAWQACLEQRLDAIWHISIQSAMASAQVVARWAQLPRILPGAGFHVSTLNCAAPRILLNIL
jgi:hypothetical protein